ncbi:hypothetical protein [Globicatella sp. PHS-GS-PNBC-21-1553]|uniref:hypothetical protein n=1 Tax=Globicatella sp. PHS-GS-PNBC-21-1553 TaxID=2885764 RepID=UPI00298EF632|nr:hypothetical protein [Globicatella sp. PHS-GS-PNBC-21-1553]WPC08804.1 hypothetical protein LB888_00665 [Globicatella sp. PHS-GS-PNBC-21-1553]
MRKEYELKFKTVGTYSEETTELTHYQEVYTDKDLTVLETEVDSIHFDEVISAIAHDFEYDPIFEHYLYMGCYDFPDISFELLEEDGLTRVTIKFYAI